MVGNLEKGDGSLSVRLGALAVNRELAVALAVALADDGDAVGARQALVAISENSAHERLDAFLDALDMLGAKTARDENRASPLSPAPGKGWVALAESFAKDAARLVESVCKEAKSDSGEEAEAVAKRLLSAASREAEEREPVARALLGVCDGEYLAGLCCHWAFGAVELGSQEEVLSFTRCLQDLAASRHCPSECGALLARSKLVGLDGSDKNHKSLLLAMAAKLPVEGWVSFRAGCPEEVWSSLARQRWNLDNLMCEETQLALASLALMHGNASAGKYLCAHAGCEAMEGAELAIRWYAKFGFMVSPVDLEAKSALWIAVAESWAMEAHAAPGWAGPNSGKRI